MNTMRRHRKASAGFTVIELLVVLIIMALLIAWALPTYKNLVNGSRLTGEMNDLATDAELARSAAIKQGLAVTLCASPAPAASAPTCAGSGTTEWNTGWIAFIDVANDHTVDPQDTVLKVHNALRVGDTLVGQPYVTFNRMGGATTTAPVSAASTEVITINDSNNDLGERRCLVVSQAGTGTIDSVQTQNEGNCP
ncbi:GspH/FimT family pseudopilin [Dyella sp.]|jgi:type IV fimbrial biogenesis protein FimT|uniref:GspH/FimT family pseudopilin n=1 Tax=Dyella sp. TaxID=1869338 RepID=UPI002B9CB450|nr:GspH/FimT family pseudopilin [Dyella sp.]HTC26769.1 GspH/FimT family pseudopilin [Dyella sp.]